MTPSSSHSRALLLLFSLLSLLALCASIEILQNGGADAGNLSGWSFDRDSGAPNRSVLPPPPPLSSSSSSSCFAIRSPFSIISPLVPKNYPPPIFLSSSSLLIIFKGTDTPSYCWSTTGTASVPSKTPVSGVSMHLPRPISAHSLPSFSFRISRIHGSLAWLFCEFVR